MIPARASFLFGQTKKRPGRLAYPAGIIIPKTILMFILSRERKTFKIYSKDKYNYLIFLFKIILPWNVKILKKS